MRNATGHSALILRQIIPRPAGTAGIVGTAVLAVLHILDAVINTALLIIRERRNAGALLAGRGSLAGDAGVDLADG